MGVCQVDADRNLLVGVLALQMGFVSREELIAVIGAWALDRRRPLEQVLADRGLLSESHRRVLEPLVQVHLALDSGGFVLRATWTLAWSLGVQTLLLVLWMALFNRALLSACLRAWRASIWGGLLGATASQCWFLGFALTAAANVRTLGLVEVLVAQLLSRRLFSHAGSRRELSGVALIVLGVGLLLASSG